MFQQPRPQVEMLTTSTVVVVNPKTPICKLNIVGRNACANPLSFPHSFHNVYMQAYPELEQCEISQIQQQQQTSVIPSYIPSRINVPRSTMFTTQFPITVPVFLPGRINAPFATRVDSDDINAPTICQSQFLAISGLGFDCVVVPKLTFSHKISNTTRIFLDFSKVFKTLPNFGSISLAFDHPVCCQLDGQSM